MSLNVQPTLTNEKVTLCPLQEKDFDDIYAVASDPKVWEQHPNKDRWKLEVFRVFFDGAMQSKGAFKILSKADGKVVGCTRFYDHTEDAILIGYTFYGTAYWGKGFDHAVKTLMLNYIFHFIKTVYFHVGADNIRSQIAIGRLGATKIAEEEVAYFGEQPKLNCVYRLKQEEWHRIVS